MILNRESWEKVAKSSDFDFKFWSISVDKSAIQPSKMDPQRNSDDFPFFYFQNPMSGSKVSPKRFSLSTVLMGPCSWDRKARKAEKPKIQKTRVFGENF